MLPNNFFQLDRAYDAAFLKTKANTNNFFQWPFSALAARPLKNALAHRMKTLLIIFTAGAIVAAIVVSYGIFLLRMDSQYQAVLLAQAGLWCIALVFPPCCAWGITKLSSMPTPRITLFVLICTFLIFGVSSIAFTIMTCPAFLEKILREWGGVNDKSLFRQVIAGIASLEDIVPAIVFLVSCFVVPAWLGRYWAVIIDASSANK